MVGTSVTATVTPSMPSEARLVARAALVAPSVILAEIAAASAVATSISTSSVKVGASATVAVAPVCLPRLVKPAVADMLVEIFSATPASSAFSTVNATSTPLS